MKNTIFLTALCVLLGLGRTASAAGDDPVQTFPKRSTRLYVRTIPPGAQIKLDGKLQGTSDRLFKVPPGVRKMTIEVELDGHYPKQQEVEIRGGRITRVELELEKRPEVARQKTVNSLPPVVVETVPQSGDTKVDPSITEIRVTFSKEMVDGSWAWTQMSHESFPTRTGKIRYLADRRTCVLPVKLQPGKTYATWLNSEYFGNFKDAQGNSAVPYLLIFETRP